MAAIASVVGSGCVGIAEGFIQGCSGGITGTAMDLAADAASLCMTEGGASAACATAEATTVSYNVCKTVGRVAGAAFSCTPQGKATQGALNGAKLAVNAVKGAKTATQVAKVATKAKDVDKLQKMQKLSKVGQTGEKAAEKFTKNNYREKLIKYTGITPEKGTMDAHHMFPQKYRKQFEKIGINIDDPKYLTWWEKGDHLRNSKGYNLKWEMIIEGPLTKDQALEFSKKAMKPYNININY